VVRLSRQPGFNVPLNGYRGLCALLVFIYHVANAGVIALPAFGAVMAYALSSFRYGVEMFFMISGFVIPISLARRVTLRRFLRERFIRIYSAWLPVLIAVTLVCFAFNMKMFADATPLRAAGLFVASVFLLPPFIPVPLVVAGSWSLTYEWVFYAAAAAWWIVSRRPKPQARSLMIAWGLAAALFVMLFPRALFFIPGVIVFACRGWLERHKRWLQLPWISFAVFLIGWRFTGADKAELTETMFDWAYDGRWLAALIALAAAIHLFASITLRATAGFAFLESRAFQFLGKVSYSFYLWQSLVVSAVKRVVAAVIPWTGPVFGLASVFVIALAIAVPLAWATWLLMEVRLAKVMRTFLAPAQEDEREEELPHRRAVSFTG
jgi:peptidoglycan/LPS O-acetylase OafA/YrhL